MKLLEANSVDSIVTDCPYGLKFMNKKWDYDVPSTDIWNEALRILKPGGHLLSFGGTRTYHRMVVAIEDAGFEIRDQIQWLYGSGFPKSHDISKAIDKQAGAEREVVGKQSSKYSDKPIEGSTGWTQPSRPQNITAPATPEAKQWQGWGTALKPANEPIVLARKPLEHGLTIAENVLKYGTGGLNIDASRIPSTEPIAAHHGTSGSAGHTMGTFNDNYRSGDAGKFTQTQGRFPANLILDETAAEMLDQQSGVLNSHGGGTTKTSGIPFSGQQGLSRVIGKPVPKGDSGGASRFFYCAKASKSERNAGLEGMAEQKFEAVIGSTKNQMKRMENGVVTGDRNNAPQANHHPTVKPIRLMEYLIKLITPPNGIVLDPFMGSGSTGVAAKRLGFEFIGIEMNEEYCEIAEKRINNA